MKILFVQERFIFYEESKQQFGLSNTIHNLVGSWKCANLGDHEEVYISPNQGDIWSSEEIDKVLLEKDFDIAITSPYQGPNGCINCSYETVEKLKSQGKKLVSFYWDSVAFPYKETFYYPETRTPGWCWWEYADRGAYILVMDRDKGEVYKNTYSVAVPQDTSLFNRDPSVTEDIDISFIGAFHTRGDRIHVINMIKNAGLNVWVGGGRGNVDQHDNFSVEDYAKIHKRSKICLNLQWGHGKPQRKGRTFELGACGKFMMANYPHTFEGRDGKFFEDGVDYVSFNDHDLINKLCYYLTHEEDRKVIADNFYKKYNENYAPAPFWKNILQITSQ